MKKLVVNDNCIGCGACIAVDSEHFDFNENGLSHPISNDNLETAELQNAISSCPVNAISLTEAGSNECDGCESCQGNCTNHE